MSKKNSFKFTDKGASSSSSFISTNSTVITPTQTEHQLQYDSDHDFGLNYDSEFEENTYVSDHGDDESDFTNENEFTISAMRTDIHSSNSSSSQPIKPGYQINGYYDEGSQIYKCSKCDAFMWFNERVGKKQNSRNYVFSLCCMKGKVKLPLLNQPPPLLMYLFTSEDDICKHFRENIRAYNMVFSFTSLGGTVNHEINKRGGPQIFQLHGANYHLIGSMIPTSNGDPKFLQLYIHDTENETTNRISAYGADKTKLIPDLVEALSKMLNICNPLVKAFRSYRDRCQGSQVDQNLHLVLKHNRSKDARTHNLPTTSEVAALIPNDFRLGVDKRDIILETQSGHLQRISELYPGYLALQYPFLFPYGEDGFQLGIKTADCGDSDRKRDDISMREFFAYRIQDRFMESQAITRGKRLLQQFLVDAYTMIEAGRLRYIRKNQKRLRADKYSNLVDASKEGNSDLSNLGQRIIMPASFTGGSRYMRENYMDAMSICKYYGFPDLFITFTCNPKWPEIQRETISRNLSSEDRPDVCSRIFKMKLDRLMCDLTENHLLGQAVAGMYTIEFQKRGLPHAHILLFMHTSCKFPAPSDIDKVICAEIPDKYSDPRLFEVVTEMMMHGPCGPENLRSPCMIDGKCSKHFPKQFNESTTVDDDGYPVYRRRENGSTVVKSNVEIDNRFVVPYNRELSIRYRAHINVEWCNQSRSIKYLFKYINKGPDRVLATVEKRPSTKKNQQTDCHANPEATVQHEKPVDEVQRYLDCRYIASCEATWRIFKSPIHHRTTSVQKLSFHLPNEQTVVYDDDDEIGDVLSKPTVSESMLLAYFEANKKYWNLANQLTYPQFPNKFVYWTKKREWVPRQQGFSVGRLAHASIESGDRYYLRILLGVVEGPKSFDELKTVDGVVFPTCKDACYERGLLDDDRQYIEGIHEVHEWATGDYVRNLFVTMLMSESLSMSGQVWENTWRILTEDILYKRRVIENRPDMTLTEEELKNHALVDIELILRSNGSSLSRFKGISLSNENLLHRSINRLLFDETNYPRDKLAKDHQDLFLKLTDEQKGVYETIMNAIANRQGGVFFVYGFGGTSKTFLWTILSAALRSKGQIVLNVASSGIASLLLPGGRTAHSRFGIPLNPDEFSMCNMKPGTDLAGLVIEASLIIWDEAPMMSRHCFETLDRSLRDIIKPAKDTPFGGKVVVFGGDFRQILPVIRKGNRADIVLAAINSSEQIWGDCKVLRLTKNMRLLGGVDKNKAHEIKEFSEWLLAIGDGRINEPNTGEVLIDIPEELLITDCTEPVKAIVDSVYGQGFLQATNPLFYQNRAILCPTNDDVGTVNDYMLSLLPGDEKIYLSADSIDPSDSGSNDEEVFSPDFLNTIKVGGLPNHSMKLKVGAPVMLLRNIRPKDGLCNGTRLLISKLGRQTVEATIITGTKRGDKVHIPKVVSTPTEGLYPFRMRRRQFPLTLAFAMTINKSQGQTLTNVGLFLPRPVFSHGQLYVALSRVTSKSGVKILILDRAGKPQKQTMNVVFKEVFQNLRPEDT